MSYSSAVLADSPLLYWKFDATSGTTVADSSGNGHTGALIGSAAAGGTSLLGDATGKSLSCPGGGSSGATIAQASWMETSTFTHDIIIKPNSIPAHTFVCGRDDLGNGGTPSVRHSLLYLNGSTFAGAVHTNTNEVDFGGTISAGTTYHLAETYDGTTVRGYINGAFVSSFVPSGALYLTSGRGITVGCPDGGFAFVWNFDGLIDEYAYYGTALSGTRIAAHYAASIAAVTSEGFGGGTYAWSGTSAGKLPAKAAGAGGYSWAGTATGVAPAITLKQGTAAGAYAWSGTAVGASDAPPPVTLPGRWTLTEVATGETWTMPTNPNAMTSLPLAKQLVTTANTGYQGDQRNRTFQTQATAGQLEWSGVILTAQHYQDLYDWSRKPGVIVVTDHLGRSFQVLIQSFVPEQKPGRRPTDPKRTYKMTTLFLRRLP